MDYSSELIYVTTCTPKLYEATGKQLRKSFHKTKSEGKLLICYEGESEDLVQEDNELIHYIENDSLLAWWTYRNRDIIPPEYGGVKTDWKNTDGQAKYRRMAARWFRKFVSLAHCLYSYNCKYIIFLDCDVVFSSRITTSVIESVLGDSDFFYHLGKRRAALDKGFESGVIGFNLERRGGEYLSLVIDKYMSGDFRKYPRWDDSYCFHHTYLENPQLAGRDLSSHTNTSHVVQHGLLAQYLVHLKGVHTKRYRFYEE